MDIEEIVDKLVGAIEPVGCSATDAKRRDNMCVTFELVEGLIQKIVSVAEHANAPEQSRSCAGLEAVEFLNKVKGWSSLEEDKSEQTNVQRSW